MSSGYCRHLTAFACAIAALALTIPVERADADVLTVVAAGRIDPVCEISVVTPLPPADLSVKGQIQGTATLNCNTGFVVKVTSANGAAKSSAAISRGFVNELPYLLSFYLKNPSHILAVKCGSATLVAGQSACALSPAGTGLRSDAASFNKTATLSVAWNPPSDKRHLIAGSYQDTITLSVEPSP